MSSAGHSRSTAPSRARRRVVAAGLAAAVALGLGLAALPDREGAPDGDPDGSLGLSGKRNQSDVTLVQANIPMRLSVNKCRADRDKVLAQLPDVITYNEVTGRDDEQLAPENYDVFRSGTNWYTKAVAVAWRSDRWTKIDSGTKRISNFQKIPPGKRTKLGYRFVNWVTLESTDGRQMSVIAAHFAPPLRMSKTRTVDLSRPSMVRLGALVEDLSSAGPVLVGGDFNFAHGGARYPADLIQDAQLVSTYEALGGHFRTKGRYTIDFAFLRGGKKLATEQHRSIRLNSDHNGVVAGYRWTADAPSTTTTVTNVPDGTPAQQTAVRDEVLKVVRGVPAGGTLNVVTAGLTNKAVARVLRRAVSRGAHVRLLTRSRALTRGEKQLMKRIAAVGDDASKVRHCVRTCRSGFRGSGAPRTLALVYDETGAAVQRVDVNRNLSDVLITSRARATLEVGAFGLDEGVRLSNALWAN